MPPEVNSWKSNVVLSLSLDLLIIEGSLYHRKYKTEDISLDRFIMSLISILISVNISTRDSLIFINIFIAPLTTLA